MLTTLLVLSACGDSNGGSCSSELISDYNATVASKCRIGSLKSTCASAIDEFLEHYPNVNCSAQKLSSGASWEDNSISIKASELKTKRDSL